jgi:hypothetical protein
LQASGSNHPHCPRTALTHLRLPTSHIHHLLLVRFADVHAYALEVVHIACLPLARIQRLLRVCIHRLLLVRFADVHAYALVVIPIACLLLVRIQRLLPVCIHRLLLVRFADLHAYALEDILIAGLPLARIRRYFSYVSTACCSSILLIYTRTRWKLSPSSAYRSYVSTAYFLCVSTACCSFALLTYARTRWKPVAAVIHVARVPLLRIRGPLLVRIRCLLLISTTCCSSVLLTFTRTR